MLEHRNFGHANIIENITTVSTIQKKKHSFVLQMLKLLLLLVLVLLLVLMKHQLAQSKAS